MTETSEKTTRKRVPITFKASQMSLVTVKADDVVEARKPRGGGSRARSEEQKAFDELAKRSLETNEWITLQLPHGLSAEVQKLATAAARLLDVSVKFGVELKAKREGFTVYPFRMVPTKKRGPRIAK